MAPPPEPPAAKISIMERRAVAGRFCASRIDAERFQCGGSLPSPCFVLPPGICPSVHLDSPVLMTFSQVRGSLQLSPSFFLHDRLVLHCLVIFFVFFFHICDFAIIHTPRSIFRLLLSLSLSLSLSIVAVVYFFMNVSFFSVSRSSFYSYFMISLSFIPLHPIIFGLYLSLSFLQS